MPAQVQKEAPDFTADAVVNEEFRTIKLSEFRGRYVVLFFYPLDFTFVCPTEIIAFSDKIQEFRKRGKTVIVGGPIANLLPEVCRPHCDVLFEGEAEYTWPRFLRDYAGGHWAGSSGKLSTKRLPTPTCDQSSQSWAPWRTASSRLM